MSPRCLHSTGALLLVTGAVSIASHIGVQGQSSSQPTSASIEGRILSRTDKKPLHAVEVRALATTGGRARLSSTDETGSYKFADLPVGSYRVIATKVGFVTLGYGQDEPGEPSKILEVAASGRLMGIDIELPAAAVITVRVIDQLGQPVSGATVDALRMQFGDGQRKLASTNIQASGSLLTPTTDDRGERRLFGLAAGEYFVMAKFMGSEYDGPRPEQFYYPGTTIADEALPVHVRSGDEVFVVLTTSRLRRGTLTATVVQESGSGLTAVVPRLTAIILGGNVPIPIQTKSDSSFRAADVPAGYYVASVTAQGANGTEFGRSAFSLSGEDHAVTITTRPVGNLVGRIFFDSAAQRPRTSNVRVAALFDASFMLPGQFQLRDDWTFQIRDIAGVGVLRADDTGQQWFLDKIVIGDRDVTDVPLDFQSELTRPIEVYLTQKRTVLSGTGVDLNGASTRDYTVVVFSEDATRWVPRSRFIRAVRSDERGHFRLTGLPPASYWAVAVDRIESGREYDVETLRRLRGVSQRLILSAGESKEQTLRIVPFPR